MKLLPAPKLAHTKEWPALRIDAAVPMYSMRQHTLQSMRRHTLHKLAHTKEWPALRIDAAVPDVRILYVSLRPHTLAAQGLIH